MSTRSESGKTNLGKEKWSGVFFRRNVHRFSTFSPEGGLA
jgi:hypothetical protein